MKRSEMVRLMYDLVYGYRPLYGVGIEKFSNLLTKMEEAGMLPPDRGSKCWSTDGYTINTEFYGMTWEEE